MSTDISKSETKDEFNWKGLTLASNFIFQKYMFNPENCKKVLSEILGMDVERVEYPNYEETINIRDDAKSIRLDVYIKSDNNVYNIEMQTSNEEHIPKRGRYYQDLIDLDMIEKGDEYDKLGKNIVIFICTFDYYKRGRYKYTFTNKCIEEPYLEYGDETTKIVINTKGYKGNISNDLKIFLNAVNNGVKFLSVDK